MSGLFRMLIVDRNGTIVPSSGHTSVRAERFTSRNGSRKKR